MDADRPTGADLRPERWRGGYLRPSRTPKPQSAVAGMATAHLKARAALTLAEWGVGVFDPDSGGIKIALAQKHRPPAVLIVRNGNAPIQMPEYRPFCSGMVGRRPL